MFLGPTGVGKTELSKALAENLFGEENAMIRIDMSEYMESHSVSRLIGSPPGYVGYEESTGLVDKIRSKPYSVVLFDEIEKAHIDVMNILLQILEDGILTDSQGRQVSFRNCVIIMTSNIGARTITDNKRMGFSSGETSEESDYGEIKRNVINEVKKEFKPEFINRIDEIIIFHRLNTQEIQKIVDLMIDKVILRLKHQNYDILIDESIKKMIAEKGFDINYGARPIRRAVQTYIEDRIAEGIVNGEIIPNEEKTLLFENGKITLS